MIINEYINNIYKLLNKTINFFQCNDFNKIVVMMSMLILKVFVVMSSMCPFNFLPPPTNRYIMRQQGQTKTDNLPSLPEPPMHLAVVACGDRLEETLTMAKSAVLFSIKQLHVHIFAEDQLHASFMEAVSFCRPVLRLHDRQCHPL